MSRNDEISDTHIDDQPPSAPGTDDPIGAENKPAVAASRVAPEPAAPDGAREGHVPTPGEDGRELPKLTADMPDHPRGRQSSYIFWMLAALGVLVLIILIGMFTG